MALHYKISALYTLGNIQLCVNMITKDSSGRVHHSPLFQSLGATSWKRVDVILQSNVEFQVNLCNSLLKFKVFCYTFTFD